jgi:hypothetical protein
MTRFQPYRGAGRDEARTGAHELRRLRNDVLIALLVKVAAIVAIAFLFFGPGHRPHISLQTLFTSTAPAPASE